jgi:trigger factor
MTKVNIKKLPKSEVEIEGEIETDVFESYFSSALKELGEHVEMDGFRKGKVPEHVLMSNLPEIKILEKMAELALGEHYPKIIEAEKLDVISRPEISITKLARKNPLGFKIKTALLPEIKLPDYKKIAKVVISDIADADKNIVVTEKEVEDTIMDIRKSRAPKKHMAEVEPHVHKDGESHDHEENKESAHSAGDIADAGEELPEFNDEFVQALGPFKNTEDFKEKLKINIKLEKENQAKEKTRLKIIEKIIDESEMDTPEILIEVELDKILYRMESDITQMGLKFEDYLKHLNKSVEDIKKEFRKDAEKKAKLGLVLNEISKVEKIIPDEEQVVREVEHIMEHYKDADRERATLHAQNVLTNEKVFAYLESQI